MKTWEMIKELTENPEKEFVQKNNKKLHVFMTVDGEVFYGIDGDGQTKPLVLDNWLKQEWEEVKEPVDFMTAFKAYTQGKTIRVGDDEKGRRYKRESNCHLFSAIDMEHGEWYIED